MNRKKEGIIKNTYEIVIKEIQTIISIAYALAVGIGMLFNFQKFSEFGINIFDYADVFDFLIVPFSDIKILLFTIITLTLSFLFFRFDLIWMKKFPKLYSKINIGLDKKKWYTSFRYIFFAFIFLYYLYLLADKYGKISKEQILNEPSIEIRFSDNEIKTGKMIGKTKDVIFLLNGEKTEAIPITSLVKGIEIIK
ncbi:MAG: hypothetical protein K8R37_15145 [Bacteroidales bacterium]|nr:hypothetical protein [Bacteroidales bacterium]